jgi:hypothetical protein
MARKVAQPNLLEQVSQAHERLEYLLRLQIGAEINAASNPTRSNLLQIEKLNEQFEEALERYEQLFDRLQLVTPCLN